MDEMFWQKDPSSHWRIWRTPDRGQETEAKMVWPCYKVFWFSKKQSYRAQWREKKKKQSEEEVKESTGMGFASSTRAAENRTRWKGIVANSSPTTFQGYGIELENKLKSRLPHGNIYGRTQRLPTELWNSSCILCYHTHSSNGWANTAMVSNMQNNCLKSWLF